MLCFELNSGLDGRRKVEGSLRRVRRKAMAAEGDGGQQEMTASSSMVWAVSLKRNVTMSLRRVYECGAR